MASFDVGLRAAALAFVTVTALARDSAADSSAKAKVAEHRAQAAQYQRLAMFREAAEEYERLVASAQTVKPDEGQEVIDIGRELALAARLRMALGDSEQAVRNVERFAQLFGHIPTNDPLYSGRSESERATRSPYQTEAAELLLELGDFLAETHDLVRQVRYWQEALRTVAVQQSLAHRIRAEVKLAQVRWQMSCPIPSQDGLCVTQPARGTLEHRGDGCYPSWVDLDPLQAQTRNAALVSSALAGTRRALASYPLELVLAQRRSGDSQLRLGNQALREAVETALLIQADEQYERSLLRAPPPNSTLNRWSFRRITDWQMRLRDALFALRPRYADLMDLSDGERGQIAAARQAQAVHLSLRTLARTPPRPPPKPADDPRTIDEWNALFRHAICEPTDDGGEATFLRQQYETCIERGISSGVRTPWLTQCERGASFLSHATGPASSEIFTTEPVQSDPWVRAQYLR